MSNYKDKQVGWIDFYHGRKFNDGVSNAPVFEGRIKATEDIKKGEEIKFSVWPKTKDGVTGGEMYSGKIYKTIKED